MRVFRGTNRNFIASAPTNTGKVIDKRTVLIFLIINTDKNTYFAAPNAAYSSAAVAA